MSLSVLFARWTSSLQRGIAVSISGAWEYARSSARFPVGLAEYDLLVTDRKFLGLVTDWEGFLQSAGGGPMKRLRRAKRTGRPAGGGASAKTVERLTGRDLSKGRPGRPRKRPV
ncbi:MAG: hypothetical protein AB1733_10990 [Thermodesulfobacteriota bacterium]